MNIETNQTLLAAGDPLPAQVINPAGTASFLLIGDHAGNAVPAALGTLGLGAADLARHIGWDIGIGDLGAALAARLDSAFIGQHYSRLVVDCNRDASAADVIAEVSDGTPIPGNVGLAPSARGARFAEIHEPYQQVIAAELARRDALGQDTVLVSLHSFTPTMAGSARPWEIGVLHDGGDAGFARATLAALRRRADLVVGDNEPYRMDTTDYTVPRHAYPSRRRYVELEVRQDLLVDAGWERWATLLAAVLVEAEGSPIPPH